MVGEAGSRGIHRSSLLWELASGGTEISKGRLHKPDAFEHLNRSFWISQKEALWRGWCKQWLVLWATCPSIRHRPPRDETAFISLHEVKQSPAVRGGRFIEAMRFLHAKKLHVDLTIASGRQDASDRLIDRDLHHGIGNGLGIASLSERPPAGELEDPPKHHEI